MARCSGCFAAEDNIIDIEALAAAIVCVSQSLEQDADNPKRAQALYHLAYSVEEQCKSLRGKLYGKKDDAEKGSGDCKGAS